MPVTYFDGSWPNQREMCRRNDLPMWKYTTSLDKSDAHAGVDLLRWKRYQGEKSVYTALEVFEPQWVIGPMIQTEQDWLTQRPVYRELQIRAKAGAIVAVGGTAALGIIDDCYPIAPLYDKSFSPWSYEGRSVWVVVDSAAPRVGWEAYAQLRLCGIEVASVLINDLSRMTRRPYVLDGELRWTRYDMGWDEMHRLALSVKTAASFWKGASLLYA